MAVHRVLVTVYVCRQILMDGGELTTYRSPINLIANLGAVKRVRVRVVNLILWSLSVVRYIVVVSGLGGYIRDGS